MTDDDLRDRLRAADPAASLAPAEPSEIARLLEDTMSTRNRRSRYALAAAALLLVIAGFGWALTRPGDDLPVTQPLNLPQSQPAAVVVRIAGAGAVEAKCMEPTAEHLRGAADLAFAGTVTVISGDTVSLDVSQVYKGGAADVVEVSQVDDSSEQMLGSGRFQQGKDYLVAASGGVVMICGFSGEADVTGLRELYEKAF